MLPFYVVLACVVIQSIALGNTADLIKFMIAIVLLLLLGAANLYDAYYRRYPAEEDASTDKIEHTEGQLQLVTKKARYRARYIEDEYLRVATIDIPIKKSVRKQIEEFLASKNAVPTCCIYYVPKSLQIIAAEIIE
jgi:hypothetical protein